jgi:predicted MFS family arabinose efflux permease/quinol monooxygenase YgiN
MHNVGAEWLMTTLAPTPIMVALMQTAENAPTFLLALPAGALADIVDRRRLLLYTQTWMLVAAIALGLFTLFGLTTPLVLLLLTFMLGLGAALNAPAWQAIVPELVSRSELPHAVSLNSVAFNIARGVGPALGGFLVAALGSWAVFFLNSLSFIGVIFVLYRWQREPIESISPTERVMGAMRAGLRYTRHALELRAVLARTIVFVSCASALWAMLPLLARQQLGLGALGYGVLLGGLGAGAILGAVVLPKARRRLSTNLLVGGGTVLFAAATVTLAYVRIYGLLCVAMIFGGVAWMTTMSSFNIGVQTVVPAWVRARVLAIYLLAFFGSMAAGSAVWGLVAEYAGIPLALLCASAGLMLGLLAALPFPLRINEEMDLSPSLHWSEPTVTSEIHPERGPVLVTVEYRIDPERAGEFVEAMKALERILRRDGAIRWGLFADPSQPGRYLETFLVETWAEHLRQHSRVTNEDRSVEELAHSFHVGDSPPVITHLIAETSSRRRKRRAPQRPA